MITQQVARAQRPVGARELPAVRRLGHHCIGVQRSTHSKTADIGVIEWMSAVSAPKIYALVRDPSLVLLAVEHAAADEDGEHEHRNESRPQLDHLPQEVRSRAVA